MGSGMLWAALAGGANSGMKIMDDATRREDEERKRQLTVADRRNELLFEMKAKADMARSAEQEDAQKYDGAVGRAGQAGDERRFSKFRDDIRATGGGEGMDESQLRDVFNQSYNQKQSTAEAGGDRYVEPESRNKADVLDELRKGGASGGLLKTAREDLAITQRGEQQARSEALKERQLDQRDKQFNARLDQQNELAEKRNQTALDVAEKRSGGGGGGAAGGLKVRSSRVDANGDVINIMSDGTTVNTGIKDQAFSKTIASLVAKMDGDRTLSGLSEEEKRALAVQRLAGVKQEAAQEDGAGGGLKKNDAPQSTKKDNSSTVTPAKIGTQAEYQALPKGARYVAPDGTIRTKG